MQGRSFAAIGVLAIVISVNLLITGFSKSEDRDQLVIDLVFETHAAFKNLAHVANLFNEKKTELDELQTAHRDARIAFKRIEFIANHFYPEFLEGNISGAPLWHIERTGTRANVLPPKGLQTLDELIFSDAPESDGHEIAQTARTLVNDFEVLLPELQSHQFTDADMIRALRRQLIAIATLGITGFDTPGSAAGIQESMAALETMQKMAEAVVMPSSKGPEVMDLFELAIDYLHSNPDFDSFDRAAFIRNHVNPLYAALASFDEVREGAYEAWNPKSTNLFDADFLNPYFYTELSPEEDSPALRKLGEQLFYDASLSFNGSMSCGSCHQPRLAFTDGLAKSLSNQNNKTVQRNAPTLLNAVYADRYFYDLRALTLEQQAEHVIFNIDEFNTVYAEIAQRIAANPSYTDLVKTAFPAPVSERSLITRALTSYVLSLQSFDSPFDQYMRGERDTLPAEIITGFNLFMGNAACATCHFPPTFSGLVPPFFQKSESEILGVLERPNIPRLDGDMGRNANGIVNEEAWIYHRSFKTTTVRNVALTAPYFHNGTFESLEQVMDFYNRGGGSGYGLDVQNQTLGADSLGLSDPDIAAIIAFMRALTDNSAGSAYATKLFN